ncbi:ABC transporter substrate-binding protein [Nonomuraea sp. MCN248]|uniref:ABC transporter substrate-binding protein n=1 Tax=Nonomuraea corallina TaxID=2989783 RepID=A0ABT4SDC7_9ACTN|nr:ABC transporter substrate-binding protein [Nonomuraea corallina]MDA0635043.1 ABC transporter substrate-binding protein [Nonomuraea corallina]
MPEADVLRELFDRLVRRAAPWRRDRPLPQLTVFLSGPPDADLAPVVAPGGRELPFLSLDPARHPDTRSVVAEAARRLGERIGPKGLPRIRFQLTAFVLLVMDRRDAGLVNVPDMEEALAARSPRRRGPGEDRPVVVWLDYLSRLLTGWIPAASAVAAGLGNLTTILGWLLAVAGGVAAAAGHAMLLARTNVRNSWFRRQRFQPRDPWERLPAYAARLAAHTPAEELELLLVSAFLEDLRQAYKRRRLFLWPSWARAYHCTLYLRNTRGPVPFLERLHTVREQVARWDPLLVVTSGPKVPELVRQVRTVRVGPDGDGYRDWLRQASHRYGPAYLVAEDVALTAAQPAPRPLAPHGHKRVRAYWTVMAALLVVPLVLSGGWVWNTSRTYCQAPDVLRDEGECVGLSYAGGSFHDRLTKPLELIAAENEKAVAGGRWVEIAYMGPMTGSPEALLAGSQGELYGIAAYQRAYNDPGSQRPKLRILLANPGRGFRRAVPVARQVVERLEGGAPLVGVIGMAQSWSRNQEAIAVLNAAGLPVMVTVGTADDLAVHQKVPAPYFFRMAADNAREARAAAAWIKAGTGGLPRARAVTLLEDVTDGDLYSSGLAARFAEAFGAEHVTRLRYTGHQQLKAQVRLACPGDDGLIFYTGRGDDFATFVDSLNESCTPARTHHVLASDDVTKYVQDNRQRLSEHPNLRLHYITLAWEGAWRSPDAGAGQGGNAQLARLLELIGGDKRPSTLHAMLAYDAALALGLAVGSADGGTRVAGQDAPGKAPVPDKGMVLYGLSTLGRQYGTTGVIEFTRGRGPHESADKPVMLVHLPRSEPGRQAGQVLVGMCGNLTEVAPPESLCPDPGLREDDNGPPEPGGPFS